MTRSLHRTVCKSFSSFKIDISRIRSLDCGHFINLQSLMRFVLETAHACNNGWHQLKLVGLAS
jgi:hypothetical protein